MCLRVNRCFLWGAAGDISISCCHSRLYHFQVRLLRGWWCVYFLSCVLGVANSCWLLGSLDFWCRGHSSTPWPDIRLNTNPWSSHFCWVTVVKSRCTWAKSESHNGVKVKLTTTIILPHRMLFLSHSTTNRHDIDYNFVIWFWPWMTVVINWVLAEGGHVFRKDSIVELFIYKLWACIFNTYRTTRETGQTDLTGASNYACGGLHWVLLADVTEMTSDKR